MIGNCIGANNVPLANQFFKVIAKITTVVVILLSLITYVARIQILTFFTSDDKVLEMAADLFIIVAIMKLFDSFQCFF